MRVVDGIGKWNLLDAFVQITFMLLFETEVTEHRVRVVLVPTKSREISAILESPELPLVL